MIETPALTLECCRVRDDEETFHLNAASGAIIAYIDDDAYPDSDGSQIYCSWLFGIKSRGNWRSYLAPSGDGLIADAVAHSPGGPVNVTRSLTKSRWQLHWDVLRTWAQGQRANWRFLHGGRGHPFNEWILFIGSHGPIANEVIIAATEFGVPPSTFTAGSPDIVVGDNVWIGTKAVITGGVTIGDGAVVGAASFVNLIFPLFPGRGKPCACGAKLDFTSDPPASS